jgi:hypothetical protein
LTLSINSAIFLTEYDERASVMRVLFSFKEALAIMNTKYSTYLFPQVLHPPLPVLGV